MSVGVGTSGELIGQKGYLGLALESTFGVAVPATDFIPYLDETLSTDLQEDEDQSASGIYAHTFQVLQGQRAHTGTIEVLAEPNTAAKILNMIANIGSVTGSGPYTWPYTFAGTVTKSYTFDISIGGQQVKRFYGCMISKVGVKFDKNVMRFTLEVSAIGSYQLRLLSGTPTGSGPYTLALDTVYDPSPTTGLAVGDLMTVQNHTTGATTNFAVATVATGTTITTTTDVTTLGVGDYLYIRPSTVSLSTLVASPFQWAKMQWCFGATASAALSAAQTRVEQGSTFEIVHGFNDAKGEERSGGFDPASLIRVPPMPTVKVKKFFGSEADLALWLNIGKQALVIRCFAGATNQYEARFTFNHLVPKAGAIPKTQANKVIYAEIDYTPQWDTADSQELAMTVLNSLATMS